MNSANSYMGRLTEHLASLSVLLAIVVLLKNGEVHSVWEINDRQVAMVTKKCHKGTSVSTIVANSAIFYPPPHSDRQSLNQLCK